MDDLIPGDTEDFAEDFVLDNCATFGPNDISVFDVILPNTCDGSTLKRTFTLSFDQSGGGIGFVSCTREYFFAKIDTGAIIEARFTEPAPGVCIPEVILDTLLLPKRIVTIPTCNVSTDPLSIQAFFDVAATEDQDTDDDNIDPDEFDIDLVVENNEGTPFAFPHYYIDGRGPGGPFPQAVNNEVCNIVTGFTDQMTDACAVGCIGNSKTIRTWTVLDWCTGHFITYEQIIKVVDDIGPTFTFEPEALSVSVDPWKCSADVLLPLPKNLFDNCDENLTYEVTNVEGGLLVGGSAETGFIIRDVPIGMTTITLETADCCGNQTRAEIVITVADNTPPVAVTNEFIITSLTNVGNPVEGDENGVAKVFVSSIDNGSYDSCTPVVVEIRRMDSPCADSEEDLEYGDFVKFCCADLDGAEFVEIDIEFRVSDRNGNFNIGWSTVRLEDKSSPVTFCPEGLILTCEMDINDFDLTGLPEAFGACGPIDLMTDLQEVMDDTEPRNKPAGTPPTFDIDGDGAPDAVPAFNVSCGFGAIRRQFDCGDQWFVITPIDTFDQSTIVFPEDIVVDCAGFDTGEPTFEEPVCNLVGISVESDTFFFEDNACLTIVNRWSVIDWCTFDPTNPTAGGRFESIQTVKVIDTVDPVLTVTDSLCFGVLEECTSKGVVLTGSAEDNGDCASQTLSFEVVIDLNSTGDADFTFSSSVSSIIDGEPNPFFIPRAGNGELVSIVLPDGIPASKIYHRAVWRATDGCNNTTFVTRFFQIADKKAPTPFCLNLSSAVMVNGQVELWAVDFNNKSFDNCSDENTLLFTFTDVPPPPRCDEEYDREDAYDGTFWFYDSEVIEDDPTDNDCNFAGFGEYADFDEFGGQIHKWEP
ncbi:hypothetical protein N9L92_05530, partial [Saprospiraceae bacterium]|nr:hypothetical protein [Saprospiraceae bacterium]